MRSSGLAIAGVARNASKASVASSLFKVLVLYGYAFRTKRDWMGTALYKVSPFPA
jgi:hypothetical protein